MMWQYLRAFIQEMNAEAEVKFGHWLWSYDNFNVHKLVRHKRQGIPRLILDTNMFTYNTKICLNNIADHHNKMEHTTTRLAVQIQNHPPFPFSWDDSTLQKSRSKLKEEDILLPSPANDELHDGIPREGA